MPPRITTALVVAASVISLAPAGQASATAAGPATVPAAVSAAGPATVPAAVAGVSAKPNLRACYDGRCKLTLTKRVTFRVSSRFGITRLSVGFTGKVVTVKGTGPGIGAGASFSKGGSATVSGIKFSIVSLSSRKAVLNLVPVR
ncbi:hypothetical protein [Nonomuraea turcica]|uniref:hypothetical protein n=1 Tax=Nonomuraea sp. G32 TaxID=3067274 RepID=UPI00273C6354|nr:hypothetical protein [Nonomuraea sp. G32]MDP4509937.1 hypothetical protein [Nonomuraea sp. G32]